MQIKFDISYVSEFRDYSFTVLSNESNKPDKFVYNNLYIFNYNELYLSYVDNKYVLLPFKSQNIVVFIPGYSNTKFLNDYSEWFYANNIKIKLNFDNSTIPEISNDHNYSYPQKVSNWYDIIYSKFS